MMLYALFFLFGTLFGSFFNVIICRMPRHESVVAPPSSCPSCGYLLKWYNNIPILSFLILRGKCSSCSTSISYQYPLVELLTGLFSLLIGYLFLQENYLPADIIEQTVLLVQYLSLLLLIPVVIIDYRHKMIPNKLTIGGGLVAALISFFPGGLTPVEMLLGVVAGGGSLLLFSIIGTVCLKKKIVGMGDVKLMGWFGALWGWKIALGTLFTGAVIGLLAGVCYTALVRDKKIPFGPALSAAVLIVLFCGDELWLRYIEMF